MLPAPCLERPDAIPPHRRLLPTAMARANVDAWVVLCREDANEPLAAHVGGENAGAPIALD